ncbi:MAG: Phosphohistidine swiveling domain protein [Planctomycetota bacterium]|nr:Phosphohistidine swiveling domain protein [Planctomycetota bacterium]
MPSKPYWRPLSEFADDTIPKLFNLRRAPRGIPVPRTYWAWADDLARSESRGFPDLGGLTLPCMIRSGSPTEDTQESSNAGRFLSLAVRDALHFPSALAEVISALPCEHGRPQGVVFLQPRIDAERAGVTMFDGFYYEETSEAGGNVELTSGRSRGQVVRGHLMRGDARSRFLEQIHRVYGGCLDIEWAIPASGPLHGRRILLQVRPALFAIRRCETVSLANHKEIVGDPPSPWITGVLAECGHPILSYYAPIEPAMKSWDEPYVIDLAERPWMNFSAFFRLMDHWGLPRAMVTDGLGGESGGPEDQNVLLGRLIRKLPTLTRLALADFRTWAKIRAGLKAIHADLDAANGLLELQQANVRAWDFSVRTNFAIMSVLAILTKIRRALGFNQAARVITHEMMAEYAEIASSPSLKERLAGLDRWLITYGHRGPLESDPCHPRFAEMRQELRASLSAGPAPIPELQPRGSSIRTVLGRPFFLADEIRERFRDRLMHWWSRLRQRILVEARRAVEDGYLAAVGDVFLLRSEDLAAPPETWRARVASRKIRLIRARAFHPPTTSTRDELEERIADLTERDHESESDTFVGIGLGTNPVLGTAVLGSSVSALLGAGEFPKNPVLIAETLEPSWAVLFPRFEAVVAELGGELSHAAILLREAGIPSVVNARGVFRGVSDGDRVLVDPARGVVEIVEKGARLENPEGFSLLERSS